MQKEINYSHEELCLLGARYLKKKGLQPYHKPQYIVTELARVGESPDVFGFGNSTTQLIEVKISKADFSSDKKKLWRKKPEKGLAEYRSYLVPSGLVNAKEVPKNWGLLWVGRDGLITEIVKPLPQESNHKEELNLIVSILRREGIKSQIFSYRKGPQ